VRSGIDLLGSAAQALKEGYDVASPYIQQGVEAVTPAVKEAVKVTSEVAGPAINKAVPIVQVRNPHDGGMLVIRRPQMAVARQGTLARGRG
jgi:hypothetical protein